MSRLTLKKRVLTKIRRSRRCVFLPSDFSSITPDYDQVSRALRQLVQEAKLIKLGYGLYVKARINRITNKPMLDADSGFEQVAKEALDRLKIKWQPSEQEKKYQMGTSTQIPTNVEVLIDQRFNRKITYKDNNLKIERI